MITGLLPECTGTHIVNRRVYHSAILDGVVWRSCAGGNKVCSGSNKVIRNSFDRHSCSNMLVHATIFTPQFFSYGAHMRQSRTNRVWHGGRCLKSPDSIGISSTVPETIGRTNSSYLVAYYILIKMGEKGHSWSFIDPLPWHQPSWSIPAKKSELPTGLQYSTPVA